MIWVAEYKDGSVLTSYNVDTKEKNDFYDIEKERLLKFGFVGEGSRYYYNIEDGKFYIKGNKIDAQYHTDKKKIRFHTLRNGPFNDLIQYKDANAVIGGSLKNSNNDGIASYNFGFKSKFKIKNILFYYKVICMVKHTGDWNIYFRIVSDKDLKGKFVYRQNNKKAASKDLPLKKDHSSEVIV